MAPEDKIGPGFAHTTGLAHTHGRPELAMYGLGIHAIHHTLNRLGAKSAASAVQAEGQRHPEIVDSHQVALRQTDPRRYRTFLGRATGTYRRPRCPCSNSRGPIQTTDSTEKIRLRRGIGSHNLRRGCHRESTPPEPGRPNSDLSHTNQSQTNTITGNRSNKITLRKSSNPTQPKSNHLTPKKRKPKHHHKKNTAPHYQAPTTRRGAAHDDLPRLPRLPPTSPSRA
ncbi:DUF4262 domain-containing protein [Streptomyces sp. NBC_01511]|uniref:DUF4262 domain-containing protein n=1 Tax=Streptomyces sp. NBC_01511 TaxID=2903889 RepID=UPI00386E8E6A